MKHIVYKTTNLISGREYIGKHSQKTDPYIFDGYLGSGTALKSAIEKYGRENFKRETLFVFDLEQEAFEKELELVNDATVDYLYNIKNGGIGGFSDLIYVFSKKQNKFCLIKRKEFNENEFEKIIDQRKLTVVNKIHIKRMGDGKIKRWPKQEEIPDGWIIWKQDIANKDKKMFFNKETGEIKYLADKEDGFEVGHPNGGITKGMFYINNGKTTTLIKNGCKIPEGWSVGRGKHKSCDYVWHHNPITKEETKIKPGEAIPKSLLPGRLPSILLWIENKSLKLFKRIKAKECIPDEWVVTDKSYYSRKKLIKNGEYKIYEK
jgi:hypothetical protein